MRTYVIHASGMAFDGNSIAEGKSLGGSESAAYYAARELGKRGNKVFLFTNCQQIVDFDKVLYMPIGQVTEKDQLGENFTKFAKNVQHDVLIIQRHPLAFHNIYYSKLNLWWTHDLALKRFQNQWNAQSFNVHKILGVSDFHKAQVKEVYSCKESILDVFRNGIDDELYSNANEIDINTKFNSKTLLFTSRPERGLENLVKPGGIMEQLHKLDPEIRLMVAGYDNTTRDTAEFYNYLWQRCAQLPNVENIGPQGKKQLAEIEKRAFAYVYPSDFEETSCITAMHSQAAGLPFIASRFGALPETLENGAAVWVAKEEEKISDSNFARAIFELTQDKNKYTSLRTKALEKAKDYGWSKSVDSLETLVEVELSKRQENKHSVAHNLIRYSDIQFAKRYCEENELKEELELIDKEYSPIFTNYNQFYKDLGKMFLDEEKDLGLGDFEFFENDMRPMAMAKIVSQLPEGAEVLDYGCANGNLVSWLAHRFPKLKFSGCDISKKLIQTGKDFCEKKNIENCNLFQATRPEELLLLDKKFDLVISGEFLEHVFKPEETIEALEELCTDNGIMFYTVPGGISDHFIEHKKLGEPHQHINYFETEDLVEMLGHKKNFRVQRISYGVDECNRPRGGLVFYYQKDSTLEKAKELNYEKHLLRVMPEQTLSVCMISESNSATIGGTLDSVKDIAEEIIIGIDNDKGDWNKGKTYHIASQYTDKIFPICSPMKQGFDAARNETVEKAKMDWVLWIDDDEVLQWPYRLRSYLRVNQYDSYAIHQHHFSCDPAGIIKTDWPCRVFRNNRGIKFFGLVHEHPETEINKGAGHTLLIPDKICAIAHHGYDSEQTRRGRFSRNWPLMCLDRKKYPNRELARFLFIRDLSHINRFEYEQTRTVTEEMRKRAFTAVEMWRQLIKDQKHRLVEDSLTYYSESSKMLLKGKTIDVEVGLAVSKQGVGDNLQNPQMNSTKISFFDRNDFQEYLLSKVNQKMKPLENLRYL